MENQRKTITFGPVGKYDNMNPQVEPVRCKYADMVAMRDEGKLIPGQLYRITDYVTTVNEFLEPNARSAGHQFDIIVLALDATTLSEDAMAARHDGDEYFAKSRLEAWELKYRLDNVQWSARKGKYYTDSNGYVFYDLNETIEIDGTTYHLLQGLGSYVEDWADHAVVFDFQQGSNVYAYYDDGDLGEYVGYLEYVNEVTSDGKGTITYLKDEFNNECPYDFKNIQYKRWNATDNEERQGLDGKYIASDLEDYIPAYIIIEDQDDFIWAYTFNITYNSGENDSSLTANFGVHDNIIDSYDGGLPNNVIFKSLCFGNKIGHNSHHNTIVGDESHDIVIGNGSYGNAIGTECIGVIMSDGCTLNSLGGGLRNICFGNSCYFNGLGDDINGCTFEANIHEVGILVSATNIQVMSGVGNAVLAFTPNKTYTQVAALNSSGQLKIYVPGDLVQ